MKKSTKNAMRAEQTVTDWKRYQLMLCGGDVVIGRPVNHDECNLHYIDPSVLVDALCGKRGDLLRLMGECAHMQHALSEMMCLIAQKISK